MISPEIPLLSNVTVCDLSIAIDCSFRCAMCHFWKPHVFARPVLNMAQWQECIDRLRAAVSPSAQLIYSGYGEALQRAGIEDLLRYGARSFELFLNSNAADIDRRMAGVLAETVSTVSLSLDGACAATHDRIRGVAGAWEQVRAAITYLRARSSTMRILINTVIMRDNLDEIAGIIDWVDASGLDGIFLQAVTVPNNTPFRQDWQYGEFAFLWPADTEKTLRVLDGVIAKKESGSRIINSVAQLECFKRYFVDPRQPMPERRCEIDTVVRIDPCGGVKFCVYDEPVGNIMEQPLAAIWRSEAAQQQREKTAHCGIACPQLMYCFQEKRERGAYGMKEERA